MKVVYACQELPERDEGIGFVPSSIFLAGPTPRSDDVKSWRPAALALLVEQGFEGYVFVPEAEGGGWSGNYDGQVQWEWEALGKAACTLFWVPRDLETMPAFTTNVEFGFMTALVPERVVLGSPGGAPKMRYLNKLCSDIWNFYRCLDPTRALAGQPLQGGSLKSCLILAACTADPEDDGADGEA